MHTAAKDLSLAELREVRSRCHAVGLGAGALGALDDAIAGAHSLRPACCVVLRVLHAPGEAEELSFSIDITSDGDQVEIISCAGKWAMGHLIPSAARPLGMSAEVTTWHYFGTTRCSRNAFQSGWVLPTLVALP